MKAAFILADGFEDIQTFHLYYRLQEEGYQCTLASLGGNRIVKGLHSYSLQMDMPIHELNPGEYDLLVIPGGRSAEQLRLSETAVDITRTFMEEDRLVVAIGHGVQLLISAQALDGRKLTCHPTIRDDIRFAGATFRDEAAVQDGNLLTAQDNEDLPTLCRMILKKRSVPTR